MRYRFPARGNSEAAIGCAAILAVVGGYVSLWLGNAAISGAMLCYTVNFWLAFVGKPQNFHWWHGALIGLFPPTFPISFFGMIGTFVYSFFV